MAAAADAAGWISLGSADAFREGDVRRCDAPGGALAVARCRGAGFLAVPDCCPHGDAELSGGELAQLPSGAWALRCPRHRRQFRGGLCIDLAAGTSWAPAAAEGQWEQQRWTAAAAECRVAPGGELLVRRSTQPAGVSAVEDLAAGAAQCRATDGSGAACVVRAQWRVTAERPLTARGDVVLLTLRRGSTADPDATACEPCAKAPCPAAAQACCLPPRPEAPGPEDCCGSGCTPCVHDVYGDKCEDRGETVEAVLQNVQRPAAARAGCWHVAVRGVWGPAAEAQRDFSPISSPEDVALGKPMHLLVRRLPAPARLSPHLKHRALLWVSPIEVSVELGSVLECHSTGVVLLVAGGTGLAPMLQLLRAAHPAAFAAAFAPLLQPGRASPAPAPGSPAEPGARPEPAGVPQPRWALAWSFREAEPEVADALLRLQSALGPDVLRLLLWQTAGGGGDDRRQFGAPQLAELAGATGGAPPPLGAVVASGPEPMLDAVEGWAHLWGVPSSRRFLLDA